MTLVRNGVPDYDTAIKGIKMLPVELREPFEYGINACRTAGILIETLNYSKHKFIKSCKTYPRSN